MSKKTQVPKKKKFTGPSTYPLPIVLQSIMRQSIMRRGGGFTFLLVCNSFLTSRPFKRYLTQLSRDPPKNLGPLGWSILGPRTPKPPNIRKFFHILLKLLESKINLESKIKNVCISLDQGKKKFQKVVV